MFGPLLEVGEGGEVAFALQVLPVIIFLGSLIVALRRRCQLIGSKTVLNEFIAFGELGGQIDLLALLANLSNAAIAGLVVGG